MIGQNPSVPGHYLDVNGRWVVDPNAVSSGVTYPTGGAGGLGVDSGNQAPGALVLPLVTGGEGGRDDYSQADSSVKNGEASAMASGTKNGGTAQTQVQGTYSGTGSFSASAQTNDQDRAAQAQVSFFYLLSDKGLLIPNIY